MSLLKNHKIVLFYNSMWGQPLSYPSADIPETFILSTDRRLMKEAVAVVFHIPSFNPWLGIKKPKHQIWVAWSMECEAHYPHINKPGYMNMFDLQMTYRLDSDVVVPYFKYNYQKLLKTPVQKKQPGKMINAFVSSQIDQSGRKRYLKELMKYLDIHSFGKLFQTRTIEDDNGYQSKMDIISGYRFTLAFENAVAKDYVTEKFYDPLIAGSVPVYLGAPNISDFAPGNNCFINVSDFDGPKALAEYLLRVAGNETLYQSFFDWKTKPLCPNFIRMTEQQKEHPFVRLCRKISTDSSI